MSNGAQMFLGLLSILFLITATENNFTGYQRLAVSVLCLCFSLVLGLVAVGRI